ncbi:MAG: NfeD family protein, partial [Luteimonas sp.]|nr:NfeD family protein [Luteimonas sp.]
QRALQHVGRTVVLERAIVSGLGRVKIGDAFWDVSGPELPAGVPVKVVAVDGMTLRVEPAP